MSNRCHIIFSFLFPMCALFRFSWNFICWFFHVLCIALVFSYCIYCLFLPLIFFLRHCVVCVCAVYTMHITWFNGIRPKRVFQYYCYYQPRQKKSHETHKMSTVNYNNEKWAMMLRQHQPSLLTWCVWNAPRDILFIEHEMLSPQ